MDGGRGLLAGGTARLGPDGMGMNQQGGTDAHSLIHLKAGQREGR
jgi:hypothetical protein